MNPGKYCLFQSGRQALSLIARELRERSISRIIMPEVHCTTMATPFSMEGITPDFLACLTPGSSTPGHIDPHALSAFPAGPSLAILHALTGGKRAHAALRRALCEHTDEGSVLIIDGTHDPLSTLAEAAELHATYAMVSLRKCFPVPDGAITWGLRHHYAPAAPDKQISEGGEKLRHIRALEMTGLVNAPEVWEAEDELDPFIDARMASPTRPSASATHLAHALWPQKKV